MYISSNVPSLSVFIVGSVGGGYASTGERRGMSGQGKEDKQMLPSLSPANVFIPLAMDEVLSPPAFGLPPCLSKGIQCTCSDYTMSTRTYTYN